MTTPIDRIPAFDRGSKLVHAVIEVSKGSHVKYSYKASLGMFYAKRLLPPGMVFPFNFGFVPSTLGEDGDPLDVLLLNDVPLAMGSLVKVHLVGAARAQQTEGGKTYRNDRLVGFIADEESPARFLALKLDGRWMVEIEYFFSTYNQFSGKEFKVLGASNPQQAWKIVRSGEERFRQKQQAVAKRHAELP